MSTETLGYRDQIATGFDAIYADMTPREREMYEEYKDDSIEADLRFIDVVSATVGKLAAKNTDPITVLYDVDETLVNNIYGSDDSVKTVVRPALPILSSLLDEQHGGRLSYGLLTSRAQRHLDNELKTPTYTASFADKIDSQFVMSSRDGQFVAENPFLRGGMVIGREQEYIDALQPIIDPRVIEAVTNHNTQELCTLVGRGHWFDAKLGVLAATHLDNPDRNFVFVDDLPFPAAIDPNHPQVRGVALGSASFSL